MSKQQHYTGLSPQEVEESRNKYGANVLTPPQRTPLWKLFIEKFKDPIIIILLLAGACSLGIAAYEFFALQHEAWPLVSLSILNNKPIKSLRYSIK